jgi:hypothetical protein
VEGYAFGRTVSSTLERFLVTKTKETQGWRRYWPLADSPALFRSFGATETTEAGILTFAEKYGCLGIAQDIEIPSDEETDFAKGEGMSVWTEEILGMRHLLRVWDALQVQSVDELQAWFYVEDFHGALRASYNPGEPVPRASYTHERSPQTTMQEFQWYLSHSEIRRISEDPSTVALSFIRTLVESRLREQSGARLTYQDEEDLGPLAVSLVAKSLLGAIWLQAAQAIEANKAYGQCRQCHGWFEVPPELRALGRRTDLGYCSLACREQSDERDRRGDKPQTGPAPAEAPKPETPSKPDNVVDLATEKERAEERRRASGGSR